MHSFNPTNNSFDISPLIAEAKRLLTESPYDAGHDLSHHQRVWENIQAIASHIDEQVNMDALQVAAFWHDVTLGKKDDTEDRTIHVHQSMEYLQHLMTQHGLPSSFQNQVTEMVTSHMFEITKQHSAEAKVLFDADKLDAFHKDRYYRLLRAHQTKQFSKLKTMLMIQAAKLWLRTVRHRFHFDISRQIYDKRIALLLHDKAALQLGQSLLM